MFDKQLITSHMQFGFKSNTAKFTTWYSKIIIRQLYSSAGMYSMGPTKIIIFYVTNGVKQGGVISPRMFTIYID